jgi:hypothetical protein
MAATGGVTPYSWSLLSQTGSNGWTVSGTGVISGTPSTVETDTLNIQVADALSVVSSANFNLQVVTAGSGAFDFYMSPTGSDSNPGTLSSPWAITGINTKQSTYSGKRLGMLPGTYDVSVMMQNCTVEEAILQINGGPNSSTPTYLGTCDSSGNYLAGTATIDCFGSVGQYGGGNTTQFPYPLGQTDGGGNAGPQPPRLGNWTIDGIIFSGYSRWAVTCADSGGGPGVISNVIIQNCTFHNGRNPTLTTHPAPLILYFVNNVLVSNCWFYDNNSSADANHYAGILIFGVGGPSTNVTIEKCTLINSSTIYMAEDNSAVDNVTIRQCYMDMRLAGTNFNQPYAIQGGGKTQAGLTPLSFYNNVVRGGNFYDMSGTLPTQNGVNFYNNTWDRAAGAGYGNSDAGMARMVESGGSSHLFNFYNNLVYDNGAGAYGQYGCIACNVDGFIVCDYNVYGSTSGFVTYPAGSSNPTGSVSFATWKTSVSGDAHSIQNGTNPFTNAGVNALAYTTPSGPAFQAGRVGGVSGGAVVNAGAWDGIVSQIGCSFADGRNT